MEENIEKKIYFIFSQKGCDNSPYKLEPNEMIKDISIIKQEQYSNYGYILYSISFNYNPQINSFSVLLSTQEEFFIAQIDCNKIYPEIFLYNVEFKPMNDNTSIILNQLDVPCSEQFFIFKSNIVKDTNMLKYLIQNSFDYIITSNKKLKFELYFFVYLFGNSLYLNIENNDKSLLSIFFNIFDTELIDVKKSYHKNYHSDKIVEILGTPVINILSDIEMIYSLISSLDLAEEKNKENDIINILDIILAYYYINFSPKLFPKLLLKTKYNRADMIGENLKKNRKIFKNFTTEIINFDLLNEAKNLDEIYFIFLLVPNVPELIKLISDINIFKKLGKLYLVEKKIPNVYKIIKPKKEDDIKNIYDNYQIIYQNFLKEHYYPLLLNDDFFLDYCDFFYKKDLNKIQLLIEIFFIHNQLYPSKQKEKTKDELYSYCYETGVYLIQAGKLINKDLITFIEKIKLLFDKDIEITPEIEKGLIPNDDSSFIDYFLNSSKSIIQTKSELSKKFFNKFTLKDFLTLAKWEIRNCQNFFVLKDCLVAFNNALKKEKPDKLNREQLTFISSFLCDYFNHYNSYQEILDYQENVNEVNNTKIFLSIYEYIILYDYYEKTKTYLNPSSLYFFKNYIIEYVENHYHEAGLLSIYYKAIIIDKDDKEVYLFNNLNKEDAIKLEDYIDYPNKINDRIKLFTRLYNALLLKGEILNTEYYKHSIDTKDKITSLEYKYALNISKKSQDILTLFCYFIPYDKRTNEEYEFLMANILFDFNDVLNICKKKYNSLKVILIYWKHFFNISKKKEIISLEDFIQKLDITPIKDFKKYEIQIDNYLLELNEAETNDKLYNSFIFMGIYADTINILSSEEEKEKFNYTLMQFNEIKVLGISSDIDNLPKELVKKLIELVYKNKDRVDDELDFIKEYFMFEDSPNFDIHRIKKNLLDKVNNYKINQNLDDYKLQFDNFNLIEVNEEEIENKDDNNKNLINTTKDKNDDLGGFSLFDNVSEDEEDFNFNLLRDNETKNDIKKEIKNEISKDIKKSKIFKSVVKVFNDNELKEILKDVDIMANEFYDIYRIFKSFEDIEDNINFNDKYNNYFWKIFSEINNYNILTNQLFYEKVILPSMKIFLSGISINYFKNDNNNKKEMYLIYEFFEILEIYKKYNLLNKPILFKVIERIFECKECADGEIVNIIESIEHLFSDISENFKKKSISNLFIRILCIEKNKIYMDEFNNKILNFVFRDDNKYLINDIVPLIDEIFNEDINKKLNIKEDNDFKKYLYFEGLTFSIIEKNLYNINDAKQTNYLEELILFYFESKIKNILTKIKQDFENKRDFYQNEKIKNILQKCLFLLEEDCFKNLNIENKNISILFNIAFVKSFLSDYIYFLINFNQEIGDVRDINSNIITGNGNNAFRINIKLYIMKLIYNIKGNYTEFNDFNISRYQLEYYNDKEIKLLKEQDEQSEISNKIKFHGFDYLFLPFKQNDLKDFAYIEKIFFDLSVNENKVNEENIISFINNINNIDVFLCSIINNYIANFHYNNYFQSNEYKNMSSFLHNNLANYHFLKINNLSKDILLLFADKKNYGEKVLKYNDKSLGKITYSYNQILSIAISLRFTFNTILNNNQNSLFYQILLGKEKIFEKNASFIQYYNKDYHSYKYRNINYLTFSIIRYIIFSHIYFGKLLNKINIKNINSIFNYTEENMRIIDLIEKELNNIKKILSLKGIKNTIVFMNYIFNDIITIINQIYEESDESTIINFEADIENMISKYLENFDYYCEEYYKIIKDEKINKYHESEFRNIIIEDKQFYNDNKNEKKYPFIKLLTLTNFSSIDDFKNQFLYLTNDKDNYPLINCLMNNDEIITIIRHLSFITDFFNEINNELMLKIKKADVNKNIRSVLNENIMSQLNDYNNKIIEINKLQSFEKNKIKELYEDTKIIDVINIQDNSVNKIFNNIINIYNEFLTNTKIYKDNKDIIDSIIIQEATKNDFISFTDSNEQGYYKDYDKKEKSIYDRLDELLYLYSKRSRYIKNNLNLYNGSKINYDLTQIENILEKEYLYGKKTFKYEQRCFIFSDEVFSEHRNKLVEKLIEKYHPQEIFDDKIMISELDKFLNDKNKNDLEQIYSNIQYILIFLIENNFNKNNQKIELDYISKILRKNNYQINDMLMEFFSNYKNIIYTNNLLFVYEKTELKYFEFIVDEIGDSIKNDINYEINYENKKIIEDYFKNNDNIIIKEDILLDICKKYILRYYIWDNKDRVKIELNNIFERECLWYFINTEKNYENKFEEEKNELLKLNENDSILMKFLLKKLFAHNKKAGYINLQDSMLMKEYDEEAERIRKRRKGRKRKILDY